MPPRCSIAASAGIVARRSRSWRSSSARLSARTVSGCTVSVAPAGLLPARRRGRELGRVGEVQAVEDEREVAMAQLVGAHLVADADRLQLLEQHRQVADLDVRAQGTGGFRAREQLL